MKTYNQFLETPIKEAVKYYKGDDRDPTTGLPKGLKPDKRKPSDKPMTAPPYNLAKANEEVVSEGDYHSGQGEKIQKRTKKWMEKKGKKGAPGLDAMKERQKEHKARRGVKEEVVDEAKVDKGCSDYGKATIRNYRRSGPGHGEPAMFDPENKRGKLIDKRREEHKARRGKKKAKVPAYKVNEATDKALEYVKKQIAAKYGKSGYVSKDNPRKPQTAAEKKKARDHQAKVDKENAAARAKDPSQGRYPKG